MFIHHIDINCVHDGNFVYEKKSGIADYLLLFPKSLSMFIIDGKSYTIRNPSVILLKNLTPFKYFATSDIYKDDYLHFHVDDIEDFEELLTFPLNTPVKISNDVWITQLLEAIYYEHNNTTKFSNKVAKYLVFLLTLRIGEQWDILQQEGDTNKHYEQLIGIRKEIFEHPEKHWQVADLAEKVHLSPSYFQVLYKQTFGTTCISDVISARITHAKELLASTDTSVNEIALELGYNQVYHFIRQFKKATGLTPTSYRKKTW